jgi:DNA-binding protein HU-beta
MRNNNMNRSDLARSLAQKTDSSIKQATEAVNALFGDSSGGGIISDSLSGGDSVGLVGFGTFSVKARAARTGRHPQTGAAINIPASKNVGFKAGSKIKAAVNV